MKFIFSLLLAFFFSPYANAQLDFDSKRKEIEVLIESGKYDEAFDKLHVLRTQEWKNLTCKEEAITYKLLGNIYYNIYEDDKALIYYVDSFYLKVEECNLKSLENDLLNNIGALYQYLGKQLLANKYYSKLRVNYLSEELLPTQKSYDHLVNLASFYDDSGNLYNSFLCAWKAKEIGEELNLNLDKACNILAIYFEATRQYEEALLYYSKAIDYATKYENPLLISILINKATLYRKMKDYTKSIEIVDQVKPLKKTDEEQYALLNHLALMLQDQRMFKKSEEKYAEMDKFKSAKDGEKYHEENRADLRREMGDYSGAIEIYKSLIADIEKKWAHINYIPSSSPDLRSLIDLRCLLFEAQYLYSKTGNLGSRKEVIDNYNLLRSNIDQIVQTNWESSSRKMLLYDFHPRLYPIISSHLDEFQETKNEIFIEQAYQIQSDFKNQILESDIKSRMLLRENLVDSVFTKFYRLKSDLTSQISEETNSGISKKSIIQEFERFQLRLDSILMKEDSLLSLKPKTLKEIQKGLESDEALLDLYFAKERLLSFWITKDKVNIANTNLANDLLFNFINDIKSGNPIDQISNDSIYNALFSNFNLTKTKNIIVHADGLFHKLPLGAIQNPVSRKFLIEDFSFRYLLSTDSIYTENYEWYADHCLGIASDYNLGPNEELETSFINISQLTGTTDELQNLYKYYKTDSLVNKSASFDNLNNQISKLDYNLIQLSMHGIIDDRYPALSGLLFENENGIELVDLNKITGLNLNTDLTIINSCHSGDGKFISGEAISSLNTSLFIGGSKANIVNLWSSSDKASAEILKYFHKNLSKGKSKSEALQLAKKEYLATASPSFRHPKYWSSPVLFGNDSPMQKKDSYLLYMFLLLFLCTVLFFSLKRTKK